MSFINHSPYRAVPPAKVDQRREQRFPVVLQKALISGGATAEENASLVDVSPFGCRLKVCEAYSEGTELQLRFFDRPPMSAKVIWTKDGEVGCCFENKLNPCLFRALTIRTE